MGLPFDFAYIFTFEHISHVIQKEKKYKNIRCKQKNIYKTRI